MLSAAGGPFQPRISEINKIKQERAAGEAPSSSRGRYVPQEVEETKNGAKTEETLDLDSPLFLI